MTRNTLFALTGMMLSASLAGCDCNGDPADPPETLGFLTPADGTAFTAEDDLDPSAPGLQTDVLLTVANIAEAVGVSLSINDERVGLNELDEEGETNFSGVTLPWDSEVTLGSAIYINELPVVLASVAVTTPAEPGATIAITRPSDGAAFTIDDDANGDWTDGLQTQVDVETSGLAAGTLISLEIEGGSVAELAIDADGIGLIRRHDHPRRRRA